MNKQNLPIVVWGILLGLILHFVSLRSIQAAETAGGLASGGWETLFPDEGFNTLAYTHNQLSVIDMLLANRGNVGMAPIYAILDDENLSYSGFNSLLTDLSGSVRFNGMRMSLSSPWLSVMNRSRVIGQWENHIIAKNEQKRREQFLSRDGSVLLAQTTEKDSGFGNLFVPNEKRSISEGNDYIYDEDMEMSPGDMVMSLGCLGRHSKNLWFTPVHSATNVAGRGETPGFHISRTGFMAGLEKGHCPCTNYGVAFGYTAPTLYQGRDSIYSDDIVVGLYFKKKFKSDLYVNLWVGYGNQQYQQSRYAIVPELNRGDKYEGEFSGQSFTGSVEVSRAIYCRRFLVLRPLAAFDYQRGWQSGFDETGRGPFALSYGRFSYDTKMARCGFATQIGASDGSSKMTIRQRVYYARQITGDPYPNGNAFYQIGGAQTVMNLRGFDVTRDYMIVGTGGQFYLDPTRTCMVYGDYDAIVTKNMTTHAVSLGLIQRF
ncbi:MAG: autotransporter outer membrane beta-barrel domain-containing protein [Planctomycetaceae bacterium]|nr:autotransporter outer membrane beta-barrel domain-containing protein [Planctomycetaceae bacterium]